jgi:protein gp37
MQKSKINWGVGQLYTWNVVTGCLRRCPWCYARRIHERFNDTPFNKMVFHPDRLDDAMPKKPAFIFIGSMSDLEYWRREWTELILDEVKANPRHTFMFLSKNPIAYFGFAWPQNTMQGLTITCTQTQHAQQEMFLEMQKYPRPFLSLEPLLGELKIEIAGFEKIIVGSMTGPGAIKPNQKWIDSVKLNVFGDKLFWKDSIEGMI